MNVKTIEIKGCAQRILRSEPFKATHIDYRI